MARRSDSLPPLTALAAFDAAARHLSFKEAARELNVTPGAVSHQIRALEASLGQRLFDRLHRGVALTPPGEELAATLTASFDAIATTSARLRRGAGAGEVTVSATTAVSSLWLTPRLARFWTEFGSIRVDQDISDQGPGRRSAADLNIGYGLTPGPGQISAELFRDRLIPLASPAFAARHPVHTLEDLSALPLIHLQSKIWTGWRAWFAALGHDGPLRIAAQVTNHTIALQQAQDGLGVVLGWERLAAPLITQGTLTILGSNSVESPLPFSIVSDPPDALTAAANTLRNWLLDHVE